MNFSFNGNAPAIVVYQRTVNDKRTIDQNREFATEHDKYKLLVQASDWRVRKKLFVC